MCSIIDPLPTWALNALHSQLHSLKELLTETAVQGGGMGGALNPTITNHLTLTLQLLNDMLNNPLNLLTAGKHNWAQSQRQLTHEFVLRRRRCINLQIKPNSSLVFATTQPVGLFYFPVCRTLEWVFSLVRTVQIHVVSCVNWIPPSAASACLPFASEVWGPQTWNACSQWHPRWHHHPGTRAGSSCWCRWTEVGTVWRALIGRWRPNSSCRSLNCCSWPTAPLSRPC